MSKALTVRFTDDEYELIEAAAYLTGESLAKVVHAAALAACERQRNHLSPLASARRNALRLLTADPDEW